MRYLILLMWASPLLSDAQVYSNQAIALGIEAVVSDNLYGAGVSFADFDSDGDDDLTFALDQEIICYRNDNGLAVEVSFPFYPEDNAKHPVWVDFDNDGDRDFFISCYMGHNKLYENNGFGTFTDISATCGLGDYFSANWGSAWGDYDLDGDLDVYICNYVFAYDAGDAYNYWDHLFRNNGDGTFTDVSLVSGVEDGISSTFQAIWMDYNNDMLPDLYAINDKYFANRLYRNNGDGTFTDVAVSSGSDIALTDAMTASCADINSDGFEDIFVTNTSIGPSSLLKNNGDGTFSDIATTSGTTLNILGWAGNWFDYDLDADPDLYVCEYFPQFSGLPNRFLRNNGNETFTSVQSSVFPLDFSNSYSSATGDWNGDGFIDLAINNFSPQNAGMWVSNANSSNNWIAIKPVGVVSNRDAAGARILVQTANTHEYRYTYIGENYLGQNSGTEIFGVKENLVIDTVVIQWPSGHVDVFANLETGETYTFEEGTGVMVQVVPTGSVDLCPGGHIELDAGEFAEYNWSNGQITRYIEVSEPGVYFVTVTTELGFLGYGSYTVDPVEEPVYDLNVNHASCWESADGSIFILPETPGMGIIWSDGSDNWELSGLSQGLYNGNLLTPNGCAHPFSIEVDAPAPFSDQFMVNPPLCFGGSDGTIELTDQDQAYTFAWESGNQNFLLAELQAGSYAWTAINGQCSYSGEVMLSQPQEVSANLVIENVSCFGEADGSILLFDIFGGAQPYSVDWSGLDTAAMVAGDYSVTITDSHLCIGTIEFTVNQPDPLEITWQAICENGLMSVYTNVSGGNFPFNYNWSNGLTTSSVSGLVDDTVLSLEITDDHGCVAVVEGIACPVGLSESAALMPLLHPNPATDEVNIYSQISMTGLEIVNSLGQIVLEKSNSSFTYDLDISHLSAGHYHVLIKTERELVQYRLIIE